MNILEMRSYEIDLSRVKNTRLPDKDRHFQGDIHSSTWLWYGSVVILQKVLARKKNLRKGNLLRCVQAIIHLGKENLNTVFTDRFWMGKDLDVIIDRSMKIFPHILRVSNLNTSPRYSSSGLYQLCFWLL